MSIYLVIRISVASLDKFMLCTSEPGTCALKHLFMLERPHFLVADRYGIVWQLDQHGLPPDIVCQLPTTLLLASFIFSFLNCAKHPQWGWISPLG
ncbi:hypothetical protein [Herbaspirillum huttiense]|uniref:hypothetical protein n=1 Tax=Herbaspirillum huttiense TaxID=863372 RepID=UPI0039AFBD4A